MVSFASALLDELMGRNRNNDPNEKPKDLNWADQEVCKHHLCSFCPHELFTNTKADLGICNKIHDDELARNYRKSTRYMKMGYEEDFLLYLEGLAAEVDRRIKRGHARLALNAAHHAQQMQGITQAQEEKIQLLTDEINSLVEKAEQQGCEGLVDDAKATMKQCDQKKEERKILEDAKNHPQNLNAPKEMEVCQICGAFLVVGDAIQRVEEHLQGKQHIGYSKVRETIELIKKRLKGEDPEREARLKKEREEREKIKERQRDEERDRRRKEDVDRPRHRSRSRSRHSRSDKSSKPKRSSSKDRKSRRSRSRDRKERRRRDDSSDRRRSRKEESTRPREQHGLDSQRDRDDRRSEHVQGENGCHRK